MFEIAWEPEVEAWLTELPFGQFQRVMAKVDRYLMERGGLPDGDHIKSLRDGVSELRLPLGERPGESRSGGLGEGRSFYSRCLPSPATGHSMMTWSVRSRRRRLANSNMT